MAQSRHVYQESQVVPFYYRPDKRLQDLVSNLTLENLISFSFEDLPLGSLILPSVRWVLRRHHLQDDEASRFLCRQYILSAWGIACQFSKMLDDVKPESVVVFNGMFYPEAVARRLALKRGLQVITHEVGMQPISAFFTAGEATAYPTDIPQGFALNPAQAAQLDAYLEKRFQGDFSMAGIRFWPQIAHLSSEFLVKISKFQKIVPVFTNVVFDTSQPHSNVVFPLMFAWLDLVLGLIKKHPEAIFVIRAHPDEFRAGKESHESVRAWVERNHVADQPNVVFVDALERFSSYELIQQAHFVMVYNSTVGLEASIMGKPVLCGGRARYTQYATVFSPGTPEEYQGMAESFLASEQIDVPLEFRLNARCFLYYTLYRTSLPFNQFLKAGNLPGFVHLQDFTWQALLPENSETMRVISDGILNQQPFIIDSV